MTDRIHLLPDNIANQIAAGEVIQRPASVVKELLENAIDAQATDITLIVKNAGKSLIQVIDNGMGMSETDARMCFEKHATSKIRSIEDLFSIRTKGFRGEAMASIAAVAQVELKTRQEGQNLGTRIVNEGSNIRKQEPCQTTKGTSILVKNLFFNVPARRNFLKSDHIETKHIVEEFTRVALAHTDITFRCVNNDQELFHIPASNLRKRIVSLWGDNYNERLVPIEEETDVVQISGFIGKPDFARKTRGEQYLFVNNRFIKSPYFNHAVFSAYENIIPKDRYPLFVLFMELDPKQIDINVHPTKQEVKFVEEKVVYTFVNAAARHALAKYSVTPSIDFEQEDAFHQMAAFSGKKPADFDPSSSAINYSKTDFPYTDQKNRTNSQHANPSVDSNWESLYEVAKSDAVPITYTIPSLGQEATKGGSSVEDTLDTQSYQIHNKYIVCPIRSGFILIDQQAAHQRILYEQYMEAIQHSKGISQKQLFPQTLKYNSGDTMVLKEILPELHTLGFDVQEFGENTFVIHGVPADILIHDEKNMIDELIEQYKNTSQITKLSRHERLAHSLAKSTSICAGQTLNEAERKDLIDRLFACQNPYTAPNGKKTFVKYALSELEKKFEP